MPDHPRSRPAPLSAALLIAALLAPAAAGAAPAFTDVTGASGLAYTVLYGPEMMADIIQKRMQRNMCQGGGVGDYDGDGDLDVYLVGQSGQSNKLFRNNHPTKTFTDVTPSNLELTSGLSRVAHFVDLNQDGLLDLLVVNDDDGGVTFDPSKIFRNNGDGSFTDVTAGSGFRPIGYLHCGTAIADYDRDGLLDIYVTRWNLFFPQTTFPGHNRLYRNLGNFQFTEVSVAAGLGEFMSGGFSALFANFDGNRYPDILLSVDANPDKYWGNSSGSFSDDSVAVNAQHVGNDMGAIAMDFDDDGDLDSYSTNITDPIGGLFGTTQGNALYMNTPMPDGTPSFTNEAAARGVFDTYWAWGVEGIDAENDGDIDIVVATGFDEHIFAITGNPVYPLLNTPTVFFENQGAAMWSRVTGIGTDAGDDTRGLVAFDYDRDGDEDLLLANIEEPARLLENTSTSQGHYLGVALGPDANAIGASVYVTTGAQTQRRDVIAGRSFVFGTPSEVHFGLGAATQADHVRVIWNDGRESNLSDVPADQLLTLSKPALFSGGIPATPWWALGLTALLIVAASAIFARVRSAGTS